MIFAGSAVLAKGAARGGRQRTTFLTSLRSGQAVHAACVRYEVCRRRLQLLVSGRVPAAFDAEAQLHGDKTAELILRAGEQDEIWLLHDRCPDEEGTPACSECGRFLLAVR
eukprot:CAMPEP_0194346842 /NCGR_PEP_ID=MMETSP0171-20130528/105654_1 /TAXON_ID=218684 /ORGANISM="Corethron pennatum, Strain L29A3" /LENGTH=110 /DNA_ID=CAMNT_0039114019 /DNA_START=1181 /DNA_END=1510 /DNA_ORIENTATION=+